ncbi:restriction endonuclease subunit S [Actinomadura violacea]|uniref:restriction endonuclease subunit S n=1 Tax=Actinomadura violacea TaxID=2819934 RepID=UPI0027DB9E16|nr:restriction endonuclease subunit S [Actinomadura violacea]
MKIESGVEYPLLGVRWYGQGAFHRETVTRESSKATTVYRVTAGQFIYNRLFAGKGSFGLVLPEFAGAFVSNEFPLFDTKSRRLSVDYLNLYFQQGRVWDYVEAASTGTTASRNRWKESQFLAHHIPLPPLPTQKRIVEVIGAVDDHIAALGAEVEALSAVLRRRRADLITDDSGEVVRAEHAFHFSTGVRRTPDRADGPYMTPYLRSANVGYGTLDLSDVLEMNYDPAERKKFCLQYGDVVVSEGSASANAVGMPAMWRDELPGPVCTQMTLLRLRAREGICIPEFVFHWSMWAYESGAFLDVAGGTNIKHISAKRAKGMAVRLPPLTRQREIAVELDAMGSVLEAARAERARLREVRTGLLAGLLNRSIDIDVAELEN